MKRLFTLTLCLGLLTMLAFQDSLVSAQDDEATIEQAKVVGVVDGHTIDVSYESASGGLPTRIRAYAIDAPTDRSDLDCYAVEAEQFVREQLLNRTVWIAHYDRETSDRELLAFIYLDSRLRSLAQSIIVSQGWAEVLIRYNEENPLRSVLEDLQDEAEEENRGIWGECDGVQRVPTATTRVMINELEANPEGLDSEREWLELYNTESVELDLSSWKISATDGSTRTFSFSVGTKISAGGYLVIEHLDGDFFHNSNEVVVLKNGIGEVIDQTPASGLDDQQNDNRCWARVPNGSSQWEFRTCTRGGGNGSN